MATIQHSRPYPSFSQPFYSRPNAAEMATPPASRHQDSISMKNSTSMFRLPKILKRSQSNRRPSILSSRSISVDEGLPVFPKNDDIPPIPRRVSSPFRAVSHMKEPFQLVLPAAPPSPPSSPIENRPRLSKRPLMIRQHSADDTVHTISRKQDFEGQSKTEPVRMLKMTPLSFPDLKASASTTHLQVCKHAPSLLPSPDFNDSTIVATSNKSHFSFHDPRTAPGNGLSPYESHSIVSSYCETAEGQDHVSAQATGGLDFDQDERQIHSDTELDVPRTGKAIVKFEKPGHRKRSSTFSSEGDWLKGTMRYCEDWLRGVDADPRRCQIVQDPDSEVNSIVGDQSTPVVSLHSYTCIQIH